MFVEHLVYSIAIAILAGMLYHRYTARDPSWIIVISAFAPDIDLIAHTALRSLGFTVLFHGNRIAHGDFHNIAVMALYAIVIAFLLHPLGVRFLDALIFAAIGFAAHLFADALVYTRGYAIFWPFSDAVWGIGILPETRDWFGLASQETLIVGILAVLAAVLLRTAVAGPCWWTDVQPLRALRHVLNGNPPP
ncbi:MAG: metal-dependent hydrolase [Methanomicrobiales archaeon]|nr:metal-dependent hydrolase [Methanomicrobiales archaeon]MDI6877642.1 metal-dependent hydrolase [Methanomicrobiales archaeon]